MKCFVHIIIGNYILIKQKLNNIKNLINYHVKGFTIAIIYFNYYFNYHHSRNRPLNYEIVTTVVIDCFAILIIYYCCCNCLYLNFQNRSHPFNETFKVQSYDGDYDYFKHN